MSDLPSAPLFELDLDTNGGMLAPHSVKEFREWISVEIPQWSLPPDVDAKVRQAIDSQVHQLNQAIQNLSQAEQHTEEARVLRFLEAAKSNVRNVYVAGRLPHSSSAVGKRYQAIRSEDVVAAATYAYSYLQAASEHPLAPRDLPTWRGLIMGVSERFGIAGNAAGVGEAALSSVDDLRARAEQVLSENRLSLEAIRRDINQQSENWAETRGAQQEEFARLQAEREAAFETAKTAHEENMANIQASFRAQMGLRAPVEYWEERQKHHTARARAMANWIKASMLVLGVLICAGAYWIGYVTPSNTQPATWRIALAVLLGVVGVWAVRLIVKMFLSHVHLATDAAERMTMVKTYLSLIESGATIEDKDREVILGALFRRGSDGLVRDEGLPHPMLELLTRSK